MRICLRPVKLVRTNTRNRRGLSLPELLASVLILSLIAGSLASVATAVRSANSYCTGQSQAAQHARVAIARIENNLAGCTANENFPGCRVFTTTIGAHTFPDALIIWKPTTAAVDATGLPRVNELILYTFDPNTPTNLLEIRDPSNTSTAPTAASIAAWNTLVSTLKTSNTATRTVLTTKLYTAQPAVGNSSRGAVRFLILAGPTEAQWAQYRAGTLTWDALDWPQDRYGSTSGSRMVACQIELLVTASDGVTTTGHRVPFFGSGSFSYQLSR